MIDLHCHSNLSDGLLSPELLLDKALAHKVAVLALTDHDTIIGLTHLHQYALNKPIKIINGIELSARWKNHDIHILGLNFNLKNDLLIELIDQQTLSRINRAQAIAAKIEQLGIVDVFEKAKKIAGHSRIGRVHFAQVIMQEKNLTDKQQAFKCYLGRGKPAYVPTQWASVDAIVTAINMAGGQAVIAHPLKYKLTQTKLEQLILAFKQAGGIGFEVVSGEMTLAQVQQAAKLCLHFDLLASTGSDYHGDGLSRVAVGRQRSLPLGCTPIWQHWEF